MGALLSLSCCWRWGKPASMALLPNAPLLSWFHGKISGVEAVQELQPPEDGLFLVRESVRHPGDYVLCVSFGKEVIHYRVVHEENTLSIDSQQYFSNLIDMIEVRALSLGSEPHQCWIKEGQETHGVTRSSGRSLSLSPVGFHWILLPGVIFCPCQRLMVPTQFGMQRTDLGCPRDVLCCEPAMPAAALVPCPGPCFPPSLLIRCFAQQQGSGHFGK